MEPKTGKRIVRRLYVQAQGQRALLNLLLLVVGLPIIVSIFTAVFAFVFFGFALIGLFSVGGEALWPCAGGLLTCLLCSAVAYSGTRFAIKIMDKSDQVKATIPLLRANTADLPSPDSLVRASSEPLQAQEGVLLRAAAEGQERHEEQLVQAVNGQE